MTKRSVETTLRDELASAEAEVEKRRTKVETARLAFTAANARLDEARTDLENGATRVARARNALAAYLPLPVEETTSPPVEETDQVAPVEPVVAEPARRRK